MITMKKTASSFFVLCCLSISVFAADMRGDVMINGGFSVGALLPHFVNANFDNTIHIGGRLQTDYAIKHSLSIGLESGFSTAKIDDTDFSIGAVPILVRIAWHPFTLEKSDPYFVGKAGFGFGFWTEEGNDYDWTNLDGGFMWGASFGTRFFFIKRAGMFIEAGYECLDMDWKHPGMELEKWEEAVSARTFAIIGLCVKFGK